MLTQLKEILKKEGGKCVLLDEDGCHYFVIELKSCERKEKSEEKQTVPNNPAVNEEESVEDIEKVNRDIDALRELEIKDNEPVDVPENSQEVKIEDLPF